MTETPRKLTKESLRPLNVRLPEGLLLTLKSHCEDSDVSLSQAVRIAIHQYLEGSTPLTARSQSDFVQAVEHVERAVSAVSGLAQLIKNR